MLRKSLIFIALAAGLGLAACSGSGPTDPNPPMMPMQVVGADSL
jgi:ABC-type glycerol-3-phosphate transport system substrate-binding protein